MTPPSRSEFLRSRIYRCALAYKKRDDLRLKNIRDLLEKADQKSKRSHRPTSKKGYVSTFKIPDCDYASKSRNSKEDNAILSANKDDSDWKYDDSKDEWVLTMGGMVVMKLPPEIHNRLKPFQRVAVKWIASLGPVGGGILADDMGKSPPPI